MTVIGTKWHRYSKRFRDFINKDETTTDQITRKKLTIIKNNGERL